MRRNGSECRSVSNKVVFRAIQRFYSKSGIKYQDGMFEWEIGYFRVLELQHQKFVLFYSFGVVRRKVLFA